MNAPAYPRVDSEEYLEMRARSTDPATSHEAARKVDAAGQRGKILKLMRTHRMIGGWTADEIDTYLGWDYATAGKRLSELSDCDPAQIIATGDVRKTRKGCDALVYRAVA